MLNFLFQIGDFRQSPIVFWVLLPNQFDQGFEFGVPGRGPFATVLEYAKQFACIRLKIPPEFLDKQI